MRDLIALAIVAGCSTPAPPPSVVVPSIPVYKPQPRDTGAAPATQPQPTSGKQPAGPPTRLPSVIHGSRGEPVVTRGTRDVGGATIRVLLSSSTPTARVSSPSGFMLVDRAGSLVGREPRAGVWQIERAGRRVRAVRPDGVPTVWIDAPIIARPQDDGLLAVGGKPYRGDLAFFGADTGLAVINVVKIDDYLRGVVPLEIGTKSEDDSAAVQAQTVAARSYAYIHLTTEPSRIYDVTGGTLDQVYGGVQAETPVASEAVESTHALVVKYAGRVVNAPYSSTCGGITAGASEVWRSNDEPYLQSVSDQIPGSSRYYCDIAPRFHWTRTIEGADLNAALARYLANYTTVPGKRPGIAREVSINGHTTSGRVATIKIATDRGSFIVRGNDIRYVLRQVGGEILNSTYFSVESATGLDGMLSQLIIRGNGYGHGVGMCQWGAIGRARAGQDFLTILRTYYPGTTVGPAE
ncbi:MAG TPA: SpoIID/LytB domain-containing protein [Gemmatimonadaceae bacterium]